MLKYQSDFINRIAPLAQKDMAKTKILASLTIAQGILESNWGRSGLTTKAKNLFGIKATNTWTGKRVNMKTGEVYSGQSVTINADFRAYDSWEDSIEDHSNLFIRLPRYHNLIGVTDYKRVCTLVQKDGYATDPAYATKLIGLIEKYQLFQYDKEATTIEVNLTDSQKKFIEDVVKLKLTDGKNPLSTANNLYVWQVAKGCIDYAMVVEAEVSALKKRLDKLEKAGK